MRTRLLAVAKRRLGSIGAARGVCSHPGRAARHESPEGELRRLAGYDQTSVSLKVTLDTGLGLLLRADDHLDDGVTRRERTLMQIASFLKRELPVRLARRVLELRALPEELDQMPSVRRVHDWYTQSFVEIRRHEPIDSLETEASFHALLRRIYDRHAPTLVTMARGVHELRKKMVEEGRCTSAEFANLTEIHDFLDAFYMARVGIRVLIGQYLELHRLPHPPGYVGLINRHTSPAEVTTQAVEDAKYLCERTHGDAPEVLVIGRTDLAFSYIPSHLYYCMFEIIKNSLRAVVEHHGALNPLPPIKVIIADGSEDVVIKISDEGGGIRRSHLPRIWSYLFTTAVPAFDSGFSQFSSTGDHNAQLPLAGLGYGLPISRGYARYFGGDLNIMSMEGYGTDAFLHLNRIGDVAEPLP